VILMPEVYLAIGFIALLVALGLLWKPLLLLLPVLLALAGVLAVRAVVAAAAARFPTPGLGRGAVLARRALTAWLYLAQPLARLEGRVRHGLTPWRRRGGRARSLPVRREIHHWTEEWIDPLSWVKAFEAHLIDQGAVVRRGLDFDDWDLEVRGGTLAAVRLTVLVEEHGQGRQFARVRLRLAWSRPALLLLALAAVLALGALVDGHPVGAAGIALLGAALGLRTANEGASAMTTARTAAASPPSEAAGGA